MKKGQSLIGLGVIDLENGEEIGEVVDVLFDHQGRKIEGFRIKRNKAKEDYYIAYEELYSLGEDIIMIKDRNSISYLEEGYQSLLTEGEVIGNRVVSNQGDELGIVQDIVLNNNGELIAYELSDGLVQDILEGREMLAVDDTINYGKDAIIIDRLK
ncbi:PRC-barrel domain-containing protein [Orenia marismortui]|uniref:Uncharacterized protein YrrD n=1 Tax=Orenia marismortui TaxID=46469 RepID=A0A4R8GXR1_9FIRM|nr:PRC-barrel domain-containing protein [Orenia marismortui]TDX46787.1 uncharacterized protein YrrD [Orenia marismortui]